MTQACGIAEALELEKSSFRRVRTYWEPPNPPQSTMYLRSVSSGRQSSYAAVLTRLSASSIPADENGRICALTHSKIPVIDLSKIVLTS